MNQTRVHYNHNSQNRLPQVEAKVFQWLGHKRWRLTPASSDASFRRYFRVSQEQGCSYIVMDAPPWLEDSRPFVSVAKQFRALGLNVPEILQEDLDNGFLLMSDLGDRQYLAALSADNVTKLYADASSALLCLHRAELVRELPNYSHKTLLRELSLFHEWFLAGYLKIKLTDQLMQLLNQVYEVLIHSAREQPRVIVHRDFHCRNLMVTESANPGILDFQDAVVGAVTYDLVSLYRDCYICWPQEQIYAWLDQHRRALLHHAVFDHVDRKQFELWFDYMGMQRHLKCVGIFSRLSIRDAKQGYLQDIPRTLHYIVEVLQRHNALPGFAKFIHTSVLPAMAVAVN